MNRHFGKLAATFLTLAVILTLFLQSGLLNVRVAQRGEEPTVLTLGSGGSWFPTTIYKQMYESMGMNYEFLALDFSNNQETQQAVLDKVMLKYSEQPVVLVALGPTGLLALQAATDKSNVIGTVLLAPSTFSVEATKNFGYNNPSKPLAIMARDDISTRLLYERLSGEDATLATGFSSAGMGGRTYISADANRYLYLQSWPKWLAPEVFLASLPMVQSQVSHFFQNYILSTDSALPGQFMVSQMLRFFSIVLFILGIGCFLKVKGVSMTASLYSETVIKAYKRILPLYYLLLWITAILMGLILILLSRGEMNSFSIYLAGSSLIWLLVYGVLHYPFVFRKSDLKSPPANGLIMALASLLGITIPIVLLVMGNRFPSSFSLIRLGISLALGVLAFVLGLIYWQSLSLAIMTQRKWFLFEGMLLLFSFTSAIALFIMGQGTLGAEAMGGTLVAMLWLILGQHLYRLSRRCWPPALLGALLYLIVFLF